MKKNRLYGEIAEGGKKTTLKKKDRQEPVLVLMA